MGFDLYFYKKIGENTGKKGLLGFLKGNVTDNDSIDSDELLSFLMSFGNFPGPQKTNDGFDAGYLNSGSRANIGTATHIVFRLHRDEIKEHEGHHSFSGFKYTGFSAFMNMVRPIYFGYEAAPIIEAVCNKFGLYIVDPLDTLIGGTGSPKICVADDIIKSWEASNTKIGKSMLARDKEQGNVKYIIGPDMSLSLKKEKSLAWWRYKRHMPDIAEYRAKNDFFGYVPDIRPYRRKNSHSVLLGMVLAEDVGYLIPQCDIFFINRNDGEEMGFVGSDTLMGRISEYLEPWHYADIDFKVLPVENAKKIIDIIRAIELDPPENYSAVTPGSFVDFE